LNLLIRFTVTAAGSLLPCAVTVRPGSRNPQAKKRKSTHRN